MFLVRGNSDAILESLSQVLKYWFKHLEIWICQVKVNSTLMYSSIVQDLKNVIQELAFILFFNIETYKEKYTTKITSVDIFNNEK